MKKNEKRRPPRGTSASFELYMEENNVPRWRVPLAYIEWLNQGG